MAKSVERRTVKVIIAGVRTGVPQQTVLDAVSKSGFAISEVVSGGATGVDAQGETWAQSQNIPVKRFPADWAKHGKAAGPIRNGQMADYAEALIAIWDGQSRGTKNMIEQARKKGLRVYVHST